jgi:8-oxo-dGTP diphosphatase
MKTVEVAVGIILRAGEVLVALRGAEQHQGGLWEFPGGKIEADEDHQVALARELWEELGIRVTNAIPLISHSHDYGDKQVVLHTFVVDAFEGEACGLEGQPVQWVALGELKALSFPEANQVLLDKFLSLYA